MASAELTLLARHFCILEEITCNVGVNTFIIT